LSGDGGNGGVTSSNERSKFEPAEQRHDGHGFGLMLKRIWFRSILVIAPALAAVSCSSEPSPGDQSSTRNLTADPSDGSNDTPNSSATTRSGPMPFIAVNTADPLLPLGRTRGFLSTEDDCVTFKVRDQTYTPVWPNGTRLSGAGTQIVGPGGEIFPLAQDVTLDGASFSLQNKSMRLRQPLPSTCPNATYAVNM
jgi:hypothetical protein